MFVSLQNKFECKFTRDHVERCQVLSEQVQSQYFSGCKSIYLDVVELDHFNKLKPPTIPIAQFCYRLSYQSYQNASPTATHICIILQLLLTEAFIAPFMTTIWDHIDGCAK